MSSTLRKNREAKCRLSIPRASTFFFFAVAVLATKVFVTILWEYRYYFPANFHATFLLGREGSFHGVYAFSFYVHLVVAPITLLLGVFLVMTGQIPTPLQRRWHRIAGRVQAVLVILFLVPSGLVMAEHAIAGPIAGVGLACLSLATGLSVAATAMTAIRRKMPSHRRWAIRSVILLTSPLLLRFFTGAAFVMQIDSPEFYRLNAWVSWLLPLTIYETWFFYRSEFESPQVLFKTPSRSDSANDSLQKT